jgi:hypothetical protein
VVLGVIALFAWAMFGLHVSEPAGTITAAEAESIAGIKVPAEATNIRAASYTQSVEYTQYLRFEAAPDVCLRFAASLVPGKPLQSPDAYAPGSSVPAHHTSRFKDLSWFDLATAHDVVTAGGGPSTPQVWVDRTRGVFYYRKSD